MGMKLPIHFVYAGAGYGLRALFWSLDSIKLTVWLAGKSLRLKLASYEEYDPVSCFYLCASAFPRPATEQKSSKPANWW